MIFFFSSSPSDVIGNERFQDVGGGKCCQGRCSGLRNVAVSAIVLYIEPEKNAVEDK